MKLRAADRGRCISPVGSEDTTNMVGFHSYAASSDKSAMKYSCSDSTFFSPGTDYNTCTQISVAEHGPDIGDVKSLNLAGIIFDVRYHQPGGLL